MCVYICFFYFPLSNSSSILLQNYPARIRSADLSTNCNAFQVVSFIIGKMLTVLILDAFFSTACQSQPKMSHLQFKIICRASQIFSHANIGFPQRTSQIKKDEIGLIQK